MRILLPVAKSRTAITSWRVLNKDQKTVVRLQLLQRKLSTNGQRAEIALAQLAPVKGYERDESRVARLLSEVGLQPNTKSDYQLAVEALKLPTETPGAKVRLSHDMSAADAMSRVLQQQIEIMRWNLPGTIEDLDTECLHDFRVALRRTRAALGQVKGVFRKEDMRQFRSQLSTLQRETNLLRDLDVYLLKRDAYRRLLPPELHRGLDDLFATIAAQRNQVCRGTRKDLSRPSVTALLEEWETYLQAPTPGPKAITPAVPLASRLINKQYQTCVQESAAIGPDSPDEMLHDLRLSCKKLRYLIEFFQSLYPAAEIKALAPHLKRLQTQLGDFNDLCIQMNQLSEQLGSLEPTRGNLRLAAAIGGLITALGGEKSTVRSQFQALLRDFSSPATAAQIAQCFQTEVE